MLTLWDSCLTHKPLIQIGIGPPPRRPPPRRPPPPHPRHIRECQPLKLPPNVTYNGIYQTTKLITNENSKYNLRRCEGKQKTGSRCDITCPPNTQIRGSVTRMCQNGFWSGGAVKCVPNCPLITTSLPDGIIISKCAGTQPNSIFGCSHEFKCNKGFQLIGSKAIRCQPTGRWSADQPKCQPKPSAPTPPQSITPQNTGPQIPITQSPVPPNPVPQIPVTQNPVPQSLPPQNPVTQPPVIQSPVPLNPVPLSQPPQNPMPQVPVPQNPGPQTSVPQTPVLQSFIPQNPMPTVPTTQNPVPQSPVPQNPIPQIPIPQNPVPHSLAPQTL